MQLVQGSQEWLDFRKNKVGASDSPIIMGLSPWTDPYTLFLRKMGLAEEQKETPAMAKGKELEPHARNLYNKILHDNFYPDVVVHPEYHYIFASLDGINEKGNIILEIKCGGEELHEKIQKGDVPDMYYCQAQHQLACCPQAEYVELMHYISDRFFTFCKIVRDQEYIDKIYQAASDFYRRMIEFDPPEPRHIPKNDEKFLAAVDNYRLAQEMLKKATTMFDNAKKEILTLSEGKNVEGFGLKVTHFMQRGNVDYSLIPELEGVDLDKYRKKPSMRTRIS